MPVRFEGSQPILRVEDMQASLEFYVNKLGFKNVGWATRTSPAFHATARIFFSAGAVRAGAPPGSGWESRTLNNSMKNSRRRA
jgi:catechol 2,3-dioxygenase-like lactoylglutathione lyase family enzyme